MDTHKIICQSLKNHATHKEVSNSQEKILTLCCCLQNTGTISATRRILQEAKGVFARTRGAPTPIEAAVRIVSLARIEIIKYMSLPNNLQVRNSALIAGGLVSESRIECLMTDGSIWRCDLDGNNWKKVKLSDDELTKKFHENSKQS